MSGDTEPIEAGNPASAQQIIEAFRSLWDESNEFWAANFNQSVVWPVGGTTTTIQGVLCHIDLDMSAHWLIQVQDDKHPSYLATSFHRERWPFWWVKEATPGGALQAFVQWVIMTSDTEGVLDLSGGGR